MSVEVPGLSVLSKKILKILAQAATASDGFHVINKNLFDETLENFFASLKELKLSGLVSFNGEHEYVPYASFGDKTSKQYAKMDIFLKLN